MPGIAVCGIFPAAMMLIGDQDCRHQQQPRIAYLADGTQDFARLGVHPIGKLAQMFLFAFITGNCVSPAVHHHIH
jgi:hypothetical protein